MKKVILGVVILGIAVALGFLLTGDTEQPEPAVTEQDPVSEENEAEVKEFTLMAGNYYYSEEEIRVNVGDRVRIILDSEEGFHDWVVDEFDAATERLREDDDPVMVEFVADQAGEFEYYCSVGQHRELGQVGTLIVEE